MSTSEIDVSTGKIGFIEGHELWSDEQKEAAQRIESEVREKGLRQVRISWADQHGIARGKTLTVDGFSAALRNGKDFQSAVLIMDTTNNIIVPLFAPGGGFGIPEMTGYPDVILVPDPRTFRVLPWASPARLVALRHVLRKRQAGALLDPRDPSWPARGPAQDRL